ncbi:MAG: hypothetical protein WDO24_13195 [Pseudomonadota bacterium]
MSRYAMTISFTSRSNHRRVLTSRTMEGPLFGMLLLEEFAEDTTYFLRPFEHYVPFSSLVELAGRLEQLIAEPGVARGDRAARQRLGATPLHGRHFWARLYHHLYGVERVRPTHPSRPYVPVRVEIPTSSLSLVNAMKAPKR